VIDYVHRLGLAWIFIVEIRNSAGLNARGVAKYSDFGPKAISRKRCMIGVKLVLITNRKSICTKIGDLEWP